MTNQLIDDSLIIDAMLKAYYEARCPGDMERTGMSGVLGLVRPLLDALNQASAFIGAIGHGDNCFLASDPPSVDRCFCSKDSVERAIESALQGFCHD